MTWQDLILSLFLMTFALVLAFAIINYIRTRRTQRLLGEEDRQGKGFERIRDRGQGRP